MPSTVPTPSAVKTQPHRGYVAATAIIWGCSTGMLGLDLLLSKTAQSGTIVAIAIATAAAVSTMTIWLSTGESRREAEEPVQESG